MPISPATNEMLVPHPWEGVPSQCVFEDVEWLKALPDSTYLALWQRWPTQDLPIGYRAYVISFHLEPVDCEWLARQSQRIDGPIMVLQDGQCYDWPHDDNVHFLQYIYWHRQLEKMIRWFGPARYGPDNRKYLASAYCGRITQSKLLIFTALAEYIGIDRCMLTLSDWIEEKNVHYRQPCGHQPLDDLAGIFWGKYFGHTFRHDAYTQNQNYHAFTANFHGPAYVDTAVHFTNESYHYSLMDHIRPGPFVTEKTLKCLAAGQIFVPVGQFDTYGTFARLGFRFDYPFDTAWDSDPGNLTRLHGIVRLIQDLRHRMPADLIDAARPSCEHNFHHVYSGDFARICENLNQQTVHQVCFLLQ